MTRNVAFNSEIASFLIEKGLQCEEGVNMRFHDVALLVARLQGVDNSLALASLRSKIKTFVNEACDLHGSAPSNATSCPMSCLHHVLNNFCDLKLTPMDMQQISDATRKSNSSLPGRRAKPIPKRCAMSGKCRPKESRSAPITSPQVVQTSTDDRSMQVVPVACTGEDTNASLVAAPSVSERLKQWEGLSECELKLSLLSMEDKSKNDGLLIAKLRRQLRTVTAKDQSKAQQIVELRAANKSLVEQVQFRRGVRAKVSVYGGYCLAQRRALGHASGKSTALMVAGDAAHGAVQDVHTVLMYEHRLSAAMVLRSMCNYSTVALHTDTEVHELKFDGTHQNAIEKEKVHVSVIRTTSINLASLTAGSNEGFVSDWTPIATQAESTMSTGDLQRVRSGAGVETYGLVMSELRSVGCPTWEDRAAETVRDAGDPAHNTRTSAYCFGVDAGPDNIGLAGRVRTALAGTDHVMFWFVFCMLHQAHLITKAVLKVMESWQWQHGGGAKHNTPEVAYFNGVSAVANLWRTAGNPSKIRDTAAREFSEGVSDRYFRRIPGRCLRGRWLSIDGVEGIIRAAVDYAGLVFFKLWGSDELVAGKKRKRHADPGQAADEDWSEEQRRTKSMATSFLNSEMCLAAVMISHAGKQPLVHFVAWVQKRIATHRQQCRDAASNDKTYLGPTPLSELVTGKGAKIRSEIVSLLWAEQDAVVFGGVWSLIPTDSDVACDARMLIATIIFVQLASWDLRFTRKLGQFPFILLILVELPPDEVDDRRVSVVQRLLDTPDEELAVAYRFSDVPQKIKKTYSAELQHVRETGGRCPMPLYVFILLLRARLPCETQEVEGLNSLLQRMAKLAPHLRLPLASDRLRNKIGEGISLAECTSLHQAVLDHMNSREHLERFLPLGHVAPNETVPYSTPTDLQFFALRFARSLKQKHGDSGLQYAWSLRKFDGVNAVEAFLIVFCYNHSSFAALGRLENVGGRHFFTFQASLSVQSLTEVLAVELQQRADPFGVKLMKLHRYRLVWNCLQQPSFNGPEGIEYRVKPVRLVQKCKVSAPTLSSPPPNLDLGGDMFGAAGDVDADSPDLSLEEALLQLIEEAGMGVPGGNEDEHADASDTEGMAEEPWLLPEADHSGSSGVGACESQCPGAPPPPPSLAQDLVARVVGMAATYREQVRSLKSDVLACQTNPIRKDDISLLVLPNDECVFVRWTNAAKREARRITVDKFDRVKTIVAYAVKLETFHEARIVIPRTGAVMLVATGKNRAPMPFWALDAQLYEQLKRFTGPFSPMSVPRGRATCIVCSSAAHSVDADIFLCRSCMAPWHANCVEAFERSIAASSSSAAEYVAAEEFAGFLSFVCPCCRDKDCDADF